MQIIKTSELEQTALVDPTTGLKIRISTTVRKKWREAFAEEAGNFTPNADLNTIISEEFIKSADKVKHLFMSKSTAIDSGQKVEWIEIRESASFSGNEFLRLFFSVIRANSIDIINMQSRYKEPRVPRKKIPTSNRRINELLKEKVR